jgi:putative serine protease PepD
MTDSTKEPGNVPDKRDEEAASHVSPSGEITSPGHTTPAPDSAAQTPAGASAAADASAAQPAAEQASAQPASAQAASAQPATTQPGTAQPASAQPASAQGTAHPASEHTAAHPTDAFGRPIPAGQAPTYAPHGATPAYASGNGYTGQPGQAPTSGKTPAKRKGSVAVVAALAIGALIGGASGAGVTALVTSNWNDGVPVSQAQGPSNVVVNDSDSVNQITGIAAKASPSVVTIDVSSGQQAGTGSGVIITDDGYVVTNTHVVTLDGAASEVEIQVKANDGKLYTATVVGTDPVSDLAVLKIDGATDLQPVEWADSSKLNVGDTTIAIGAPLGLSGTVTTGIVSALNRSITVASSAAPTTPEEQAPDQGDGQSPFDFWNFDIPGEGQEPGQQQAQSSISLSVVQTDAAINPGNSGGALLNSKGELIGINVAIANASSTSATAGSIGVGFALPSNLAKRVADEIIANGKASHGLLGATVGNAASAADSTTVGALINEVTSGGAAEKAGLTQGDIITNFNGVPITDANDLTAQVRALPAGGKAELTYVRDGKSVTVSVTVGELAS